MSTKRFRFMAAGAILCLFVSAASSAADGTARESRPISGIDHIVVRSIGDLVIAQGDAEALVVEAEPRLLPRISSEVKGRTLVFDVSDGVVSTRFPVRFHVTVKNLSGIEAHGSGEITAAKLHVEGLNVILAGSGSSSIEELSAKSLAVNLEGAGRMVVAGGATLAQTIAITGAGDYRAPALRSANASVQIRGSGSVELWASDALDVSIAGSGDVRYRGDPKVTWSIAGSGGATRVFAP